jgi:hypothetical protein
MNDHPLTRRRFLECAAMTIALLPIDPAAAPGMASRSVRASQTRLTLFDGRFDRATEFAADLAAGGATRNINGDATEIVLWLTSARHRANEIQLRGITLESIPFCLAHHAPRAHVVMHRLDRDLIVWSFDA